MGDPQLMANILNRPVVFNFRQADILSGGEGAPLIPVYHQLLMHKTKTTAVLNIGGVSNLTLRSGNALYAGDVGPGCALINDCVLQHFNKAFDENGALSKMGKPDINLINTWLNNPFFTRPFPKSLDRNSFKNMVSDLNNMPPHDQLATLTFFTSMAIQRHLSTEVDTIYVCGGGRHNDALMAALNTNPTHTFVPIDDLGFAGDFIEAQGFAYITARHINQLPTSYPTTTGAENPTIAGEIFLPKSMQ
jgi:anhydro-N-acetylmuramic acid kinase